MLNLEIQELVNLTKLIFLERWEPLIGSAHMHVFVCVYLGEEDG